MRKEVADLNEVVPTRISTDSVDVPGRLAYWNAVNSRLFGELMIESRSRKPFAGQLIRLPLRDCELYRILVSPMELTRAPNTSNRRPARVYALEVLVSGQGTMKISGQESRMLEGDMVILDAAASTYFCFDEQSIVLTLVLPASGFKVRRLPLQSIVNRRIEGAGSNASFLSRFLCSPWEGIEAAGVRTPDKLSETIWSLVDLAFHGDVLEGTSQAGKRREKLEDACRMVEREVNNPTFNTKALSDALDVSQRYLQMLFSDLNTTPSRYLLERRLDVAATRLRCDPRARITDVAFDAGFNSSTYFSRAFRDYFQLSPRQYRARRMVPDGDATTGK